MHKIFILWILQSELWPIFPEIWIPALHVHLWQCQESSQSYTRRERTYQASLFTSQNSDLNEDGCFSHKRKNSKGKSVHLAENGLHKDGCPKPHKKGNNSSGKFVHLADSWPPGRWLARVHTLKKLTRQEFLQQTGSSAPPWQTQTCRSWAVSVSGWHGDPAPPGGTEWPPPWTGKSRLSARPKPGTSSAPHCAHSPVEYRDTHWLLHAVHTQLSITQTLSLVTRCCAHSPVDYTDTLISYSQSQAAIHCSTPCTLSCQLWRHSHCL